VNTSTHHNPALQIELKKEILHFTRPKIGLVAYLYNWLYLSRFS